MATQSEIREQITSRIVEALKAGTAPWRRPWSNLTNTGSPANVVSKRPYTGVNTLLLELVAQERGYSSRWWGTFRQWQELGCRVKPRPAPVRPGDFGTKVVFCKPVTKAAGHAQADEGGGDGHPERESRYFLLRQFTVFNAEQVEGEAVERLLARPHGPLSFQDFTPAEAAVAATGARIEYGGDKAVYYPEEDYIRLPAKEAFTSVQEFYATAFHELAHWSGHESRLNRLVKHARFGSHAYAVEELVAEMAGCFLCNETGVQQSSKLDNHAAYLASWLAVLQADSSAIFTAASQASAATDFILRFSRQEPDGGAGEEIEATVAGVGG